MLIDCEDVADIGQTFYNVNTISDISTNLAGDPISTQFLKEIGHCASLIYISGLSF